ncbi:Fur family transcriptional regulator [Donghicola sp. XS_ASV15]|uniref:Fur family transcriptional regulator n=1 Tax=Donghicola sp. XS_ASV15 TaxID=3241295 RepID=UPI00351360E4
MKQAEVFFQDKPKKLTPARRRVLEILLAHGGVLSAYQILDRLKSDGKAAHPADAYRALDFLIEYKFVHKVGHLSAFVAYTRPHATHTTFFMICRKCDNVAEAASPDTNDMLEKVASEAGFLVKQQVLEAFGICTDCQDDAGTSANT